MGFYMLDEGIEGDWQSPTPEMKSVVAQYVAADYTEVKLTDFISGVGLCQSPSMPSSSM
jgi:hypothetical protein